MFKRLKIFLFERAFVTIFKISRNFFKNALFIISLNLDIFEIFSKLIEQYFIITAKLQREIIMPISGLFSF